MGRYLVWEPANGQSEQDGQQISANTPNQAAEQWADLDDFRSTEFHIVGGQPSTVVVLDLDGGARGVWRVSGESIRRYTARPA